MGSQILRPDIAFRLSDDARVGLLTGLPIQMATNQIVGDLHSGSIKEGGIKHRTFITDQLLTHSLANPRLNPHSEMKRRFPAEAGF